MQKEKIHLLFSLFFFIFSFNTHLFEASTTSTISTAESLSGNQTIISKSGKFELGFFSPGNSTNYYIGIWYKRITPQTVVWVANRETPLPRRTTSAFKMLEDGNLVLLNESQIQVWSTNIAPRASNSTILELLDSGNLVLVDGSNSSNLIWQSFEHPTDTWLPGARIHLNKITGENQCLTSWRNSEDPSPGDFTLAMDPDGTDQFFIMRNGSVRFWTSGIWNGHIFSSIPEMAASYFFNFSYVSNDRENSLSYYRYDDSITSRFVKDSSRFIMDSSGQFKHLSWVEEESLWAEEENLWMVLWIRPMDRCEVYSLCGSFGVCNQRNLPLCTCLMGFEPRSPKDWNFSEWSGGCLRKTPLQCEYSSSVDKEEDKFSPLPNVRLPVNGQSSESHTAESCRLACLSSCSCIAYAFTYGCLLWNRDLLNLNQLFEEPNNGRDIWIRLASSELPKFSGKSGTLMGGNLKWVIAGVGGIIVALAIVSLLIWIYRRAIRVPKVHHGCVIPFRYKELHRATRKFSERIGGGGFGSVFKGALPDSTAIAVKKLEGLRQGDKQFQMEVSTIGKIHHVNLIHLLGYCSKGDKRLLVYEYMPKGSLDSHLFQEGTLDWKTRYQIAVGIARGMAYLHEKCRDCIVHCDIKPENILLNDTFCPKVTDFGLAKFIGRDFSRVLTTMRGTRGYLAPEWISGQPITPKADVYSYGMMLFEVISGKRNIQYLDKGIDSFFPTWAANRIISGEVLSLLDNRLEGKADIEELIRACRIACWCIQDDEKQRPSMGQVVQILEGVLEVNTPPMPQLLQLLDEDGGSMAFVLESSDLDSQELRNM